MDLTNLKERIKLSLAECQKIIASNPNVVLSEADFERLVCECISRELNFDISHPKCDDYSIHTQVSHYSDENDELNYRIDILLIENEKIEKCLELRKQFKYAGDAFALELKYLHSNETVNKVECDFCKRKNLELSTWLYIVVLIDSDDDVKFEEKKKRIEDLREDYIRNNLFYEGKLFSEVLKKQI